MNSYIKYISYVVAVVVLQSCSSGLKQYQKSDPYKLEAYRADRIAQDTSSLAQYDWAEMFTDTILQSHIATALAENIDVLVAEENLKIAANYLWQSKAAYQPTVTGDASLAFASPSQQARLGFADRIAYTDMKIGASFSWEADIWGKIKSQNKAVVADYLRSENFNRLIKSQVVSQVATNYYLLLSLDAKMEIILSTIRNREESLETIKAFKEAGQVTEVAVKQNEALLYTAQALLIDIQNGIKLRENSLRILMGQVPGDIKRTKLDQQVIMTNLEIGLPVQLLSQRPDVLAAEYNLVSAFELTNVANTNFYPKLSISGSAGLNSENFFDLFGTNGVFANLISNLTYPILNQRRLKTQQAVSLNNQELALLDYKSSILTAYREVSDGVYNFQANQDKHEIKMKQSEALARAIEYSEELLIYGMADYLEVLTAKDNLLQTQLEMIDIEVNELNSTVDIYRALGGGWQ